MSSLIWIELDAHAPAHNINEIRTGLQKEVLICAVVKANAYGHGVRQMIPLLKGVDWFAVNSLEEGLELQEIGVQKPVLVLGHIPISRLPEAVEAGFRLTVFNMETITSLSKLNTGSTPVRIHLKIETGTGRQGILPGQVADYIREIQESDRIVLEGVSTHFANIEDTLNYDYSHRQLTIFRNALENMQKLGENPPVIHTACTAAAILFPETHFSMIRIGIGVYGLWPSRETFLSATMRKKPVPDLRPVLTWKTRVAQLKDLPEGSFVGYGCSYRTTRKTRVAILPVGYADGYDRSLGNIAYVLVKGKRAPVIGRVCMNLTMIDVTDIPDVVLENEVVLLGRWGGEVISAETMAGWAQTINYEIVTRISPFLERRVVNRKSPAQG